MKTEIDLDVVLQDSKPYYVQVYDYLNKLILSNTLKPGDKLPSEKELEKSFSVSKITVRRAIQELAYENRVVKIAGKGSFVLKPKIEPLTALTSFSENMLAQGYQPSYINSKISLVVPHSKISDILKTGKNEKVLEIYRLMMADGLPMTIQQAYIPAYIYEKDPLIFTPEMMDKISLYKILELEFGIELYRAEERVDASKASQEEADLLKIGKDDSILVIERITYSKDESPIEYVKMIYAANRYRYKVELFRTHKKGFERR